MTVPKFPAQLSSVADSNRANFPVFTRKRSNIWELKWNFMLQDESEIISQVVNLKKCKNVTIKHHYRMREFNPCISEKKLRGGGDRTTTTDLSILKYSPQTTSIHLTLIFIIHNKYISTLYLYTYIHTHMNCSSQLLLMIYAFY